MDDQKLRGRGARMNLRRGLLRLWLVASVLFIIVAGVSVRPEVAAEFDAARRWAPFSGARLVPITCGAARGSLGVDYQTALDLEQRTRKPVEVCWYPIPKFRVLYPEYNDLSDDDLTSQTYAKMEVSPWQPPTPWTFVAKTAAIVIGIPVAVLIVGAAIFWAFAGFHSNQNRIQR